MLSTMVLMEIRNANNMKRDANSPKKVWAFADSFVPLHPERAFFGFV